MERAKEEGGVEYPIAEHGNVSHHAEVIQIRRHDVLGANHGGYLGL